MPNRSPRVPVGRLVARGVGAILAGWVLTDSAVAQDNAWDPFKERDAAARNRRAQPSTPANSAPPLPSWDSAPPRFGDRAPAAGQPAVTPNWPAEPPAQAGAQPSTNMDDPRAQSPGTVETGRRPVARQDLEPVVVADGTGLPLEFWRGVDMAAAEALMAPLELPPRSPALHGLWRRMLRSEATPPAGAPSAAHFRAVRLEGLYRSGLIADMGDVIAAAGADATSPLVAALALRRELVAGDRKAVCDGARQLAGKTSADAPRLLKGEANLIAGYCAALDGNTAAAGLAAEIAREEGVDAPLALQVLDGLAIGAKPKTELPTRLTVLDYRFLELLGPVEDGELFEKAEPALLVALATAAGGEPRLRIAAGEAAARRNALAPDALAQIYRAAADTAQAKLANDPLLRRATLYREIETETNAPRRGQLARQLLDDARKSGLYLQILRALAKPLAGVQPGPDTGALAEIAIEAALANGDIGSARPWLDAFPALGLWSLLADIDDIKLRAARPQSLAFAEAAVQRGRFSPEALHRLASVLDALDTDVPLTIWDAAGRTPQPTRGYLPDTGMLSQLQVAAKQKETARVVLLALRTLGPNGAEGAHMIALGDTIRALRKAGLEADARHVAVEALFSFWPRGAAN